MRFFGGRSVKGFKISQSDFYRTPWVAALWSLFLPGFGQFYNRDFLVGIVLMAWEILINSKANINTSVYHTFNGNYKNACEVLNFQWALFYPSIYAFSMWQAYNRAKTINHMLMLRGIPAPEKATHFNGLFMGLLLGLFFGIVWCLWGSPTAGAVGGGLIGALAGLLLDRLRSR